jgi:hypothetical protein
LKPLLFEFFFVFVNFKLKFFGKKEAPHLKKIVIHIFSVFLVFVLFLNFTVQVVSFKTEKKKQAGVCCCGESCDCGCGGMCALNKGTKIEISISSAPCSPIYKVNLDFPVKEALTQSFNFPLLSFSLLEFLKPSGELYLKVLCFEVFHPPDFF